VKGIVSFNIETVVDRRGALWQALRAWPKIELHRHLEGSIRLETLIDLAQAHAVPLPATSADQLRPFVQMTPEDAPSAAVFLSKFEVLRQFYRSLAIIDRITREAVADAAADGVRYMELRFTPAALVRHNNYSFGDVIGCVAQAAAAAQREHGITVKLIASVNRHEPVEVAGQVLDAVLALNHPDIVALDLAGREVGCPAEPFLPVFNRAREAGLHVTIHAGEWAGAENVREAVMVMGAERIGHGVRVIEDIALAEQVRERGVTLEVCPTSNLQSGVAAQVDQHPLVTLAQMGVPLTLNTDDPAISSITLTDELALAHVGMGLPLAALRAFTVQAAEAAFLPAEQRAALVREFRAMPGPDDLPTR